MSWGIIVKHTKPEGVLWPQDFLDQTTDPAYDDIKQGRFALQDIFQDRDDPTKTRQRWVYPENEPNVRYLQWSMPQFGILSTGLDVNNANDIKKIRLAYDINKVAAEMENIPSESGNVLDSESVVIDALEQTFADDAGLAVSNAKKFRLWHTDYQSKNNIEVSIVSVENLDF